VLNIDTLFLIKWSNIYLLKMQRQQALVMLYTCWWCGSNNETVSRRYTVSLKSSRCIIFRDVFLAPQLMRWATVLVVTKTSLVPTLFTNIHNFFHKYVITFTCIPPLILASVLSYVFVWSQSTLCLCLHVYYIMYSSTYYTLYLLSHAFSI